MGLANGLQRIPSDISLRCSTGGANDDSCRSQVRRTVSERQLGSGAGSFGALLQKFQDDGCLRVKVGGLRERERERERDRKDREKVAA